MAERESNGAFLVLHRDDCWSTRYKLSLKLYDAAVEALFATGDFTALTDLTSKVLSNARNFDDKLNCYHNLVRYLASSRQSEEGLATCIKVLEELGEQDGIYMGMGITVGLNMCSVLGESLPTQLTDVIVYKHYRNMKSLLRKISEDDILSFPRMVNERKLMAMEFLNHMVSSCNATRPHLCAVVVCLMVSMTLDYGLCDISACAFSGFGNMSESSLSGTLHGPVSFHWHITNTNPFPRWNSCRRDRSRF